MALIVAAPPNQIKSSANSRHPFSHILLFHVRIVTSSASLSHRPFQLYFLSLQTLGPLPFIFDDDHDHDEKREMIFSSVINIFAQMTFRPRVEMTREGNPLNICDGMPVFRGTAHYGAVRHDSSISVCSGACHPSVPLWFSSARSCRNKTAFSAVQYGMS